MVMLFLPGCVIATGVNLPRFYGRNGILRFGNTPTGFTGTSTRHNVYRNVPLASAWSKYLGGVTKYTPYGWYRQVSDDHLYISFRGKHDGYSYITSR